MILDNVKKVEELNNDLNNNIIELNQLKDNYNNLDNDYKNTKKELNDIYNSKGYKLLNKFYRLKGSFKRKK